MAVSYTHLKQNIVKKLMRESANYYGTIQKSIGLRMRAKHICL